MGRVFKLKKSWAIKYDLPGSTRDNRSQKQLSGFRTEKEASDALTLIEAKIIKNEYIVDTKLTVGDMLDIWLKDHVRANLKPKTYLFYKNYVDVYLKPNLGHLAVSKVKAKDIIAFNNKLKDDKVSKGVIDKCHKTLRAALNKAYAWELIDRKIMDKISAPTVTKKPIKYWDEESIKKGLKLFKNSSIYFNIFMAVNLGLREGESCGLKVEDFNFKSKILHIRRAIQKVKDAEEYKDMNGVMEVIGDVIVVDLKNDPSYRLLPLTDDIIKFVKSHIKSVKKNQLFFGESYNKDWLGYLSVDIKGDIIHDQKVCGRFRREISKKDLPKITFHGLRHSCASWLYAKDVSLKTIQEILGHSMLSTTTDIYTHLDIKKKREAFERIHALD